MPTPKEHHYGKMVVDRFREKRANRVNNEMIKKGLLWYENSVPNTPILERLAHIIPEIKVGEGISNFRDLGNENYRTLLRSLGKLDDSEQLFFKTFINSNFQACHATVVEDYDDKDGKDMVLFSRKKLIENNIVFNTQNSPEVDIISLANDDNVFFSLEIGTMPQKIASGGGSRFGIDYYKVSYSESAFDYSSLYLFDQLTMQIPSCRITGISNEAQKILNTREYTRRSICFYGRKSLPGLVLSIIAVTRLLPEKDRQVVLGARTEKEKNNLLRYLFRIEIRVPRIVGIKYGDYKFFRKREPGYI